MKKALIISALLLTGLFSHAQIRITKDAQGNYKILSPRDTTNKPTGHTITDKDGIIHPVYISSRGKLYWLRTSKSGNVYKAYIKTDQK